MVISSNNSSVLLHGLSAALMLGSMVEVAVVDSVSPSFQDAGLPEPQVSLLTELLQFLLLPLVYHRLGSLITPFPCWLVLPQFM
jgi:hypothetical protein